MFQIASVEIIYRLCYDGLLQWKFASNFLQDMLTYRQYLSFFWTISVRNDRAHRQYKISACQLREGYEVNSESF